MPAQAAVGVTALPASETVLETEADTDGNTEETSLAETDSEADTEAPAQEVETETPDQEVETAAPAQDADKSELTAASVNDSEFKDEPAQNDDAALIGNSDQEGDSELTEDPGQKDDSLQKRILRQMKRPLMQYTRKAPHPQSQRKLLQV